MKTTRILAILVLALGLTYEVSNADFTFGEPTNLGPPINTAGGDHSACISTDGLSLYFSRGDPEGEIWESRWVTSQLTTEGVWGTPVNLKAPVNSAYHEYAPSISADELELYFTSDRPGGLGGRDLWVTTRPTVDDNWGTPVNLEAPVNSAYHEYASSMSADELELYFTSDRSGGYGDHDLWLTTRPTKDEDWGDPINLGSKINTSSRDNFPGISPDGLLLFFGSNRSGGSGSWELYMARRVVNSTTWETGPKVSSDGSMLYFQSPRPGGVGSCDIWQVSIEPVVDLNSDGIVDAADMCIIVDNWGTDESLCDIGPMPWGDGIVDVQDLIVLAEHLFEEFPPVE